eukprot:COSAG03_NODE_1951_length_3307_cov_16.956671_3_plen_162_part_00
MTAAALRSPADDASPGDGLTAADLEFFATNGYLMKRKLIDPESLRGCVDQVPLSVCLSVCLPACLPACLSVCLSVCLSHCLCLCLCLDQFWDGAPASIRRDDPSSWIDVDRHSDWETETPEGYERVLDNRGCRAPCSIWPRSVCRICMPLSIEMVHMLYGA